MPSLSKVWVHTQLVSNLKPEQKKRKNQHIQTHAVPRPRAPRRHDALSSNPKEKPSANGEAESDQPLQIVTNFLYELKLILTPSWLL